MSRRPADRMTLHRPSPKHLPRGERRRRVLELLAKGALRAAATQTNTLPVDTTSKADASPGGSNEVG
jgi:hypothetical protein